MRSDNLYRCLECGEVFEEPSTYSEDRTPGGVNEGGSFIYHYKGCPVCEGSYEEIEEDEKDEDEEDD